MNVTFNSRESVLQVNVRERIEQGRLPGERPTQITAGYGSGQFCVVCDQPIGNRQVEYEVEDSQTGRTLHFHSQCHSLWECECAGQ